MFPRIPQRYLLIIVLLLIAAVLVACGGDDDGDRQASRPTDARATVPVFPSATAPLTGPTLTPLPSGPTPTRFAGFPTLPSAPTLPSRYPNNIQIVSPVTGSVAQGVYPVFGSASHPDFIQYALEYGPDPNPGNLWYPITPQAVTVPVINNVLGSWNTSRVSDGSYQVRLHIYLSGGRELTNVIVSGIQVQNQAPTEVAVATNTNPTISPVASLNLEAGRSATIALGIFDADGDPTTFVATSDNLLIATVTPAGNAITVNALNAGIATIRIVVNDDRGGSANTSFLVTVSAPINSNSPPGIDPIPSQVITQGATVVVPVTLTDPDGDTVDFTVESSQPSIAQATKGVDGRSINLAGFTPGSTTITITATDAPGNSATSVFAIVVNPPEENNNPPSLAAIPSQGIEVAETRDVTLSISDPDGDATTFTVENEDPSVASVQALNNNTIQLNGLSAGQTRVVITVSDAPGATTTSQFVVFVTEPPAPNQPPTIAAIPDQTIEVGQRLEIDMAISDPDSASTTYSVTSDTTGVAATGPTDADTFWIYGVAEGTATITVSVGDGDGNSTTATFAVIVNPAPIPNQPPTIDPISPQTVEVGQAIQTSLNYGDPDEPLEALTILASSSASEVATVYQSGQFELTIVGVAEGTANITVTVSDGHGDAANTQIVVVVEPVNLSPRINPIASQRCAVGDIIDLPLVYDDPNGDSVTILPQSSDAIIASTAMLDATTLRLSCLTLGNATITVQASDGSLDSTTTFVVAVVNRNPTIDPIPSLNVGEGDEIAVPLTYSDPDGDTLTITAVSDNQAVATVATGRPTEAVVTGISPGTATITVTVDDGNGGIISTAFTVGVEIVNEVPTIDSLDPVNLEVGQNAVVNLNYSDPDGDALHVEATSDNEGVAQVDVTTPTTLTVSATGEGTATITVMLDDGRGGSTDTIFTVTVVQPNLEPIIDPISPVGLNTGDSITVPISAIDPNGDELTVSATSSAEAIATVSTSAPSELTVTGVGEGTTIITVTVDDGRGGIANTAFEATVQTPNESPIIDPIAPVEIAIGDSATVSVVASDPNGDELTLNASSDNEGVAVVFINTPTELTVTGVGTGTATVTATVDDGRGGTVDTAFTVTVIEANQDPVIDPIAPITVTTGDSALVAITASDPNGDELILGATSDNEAVATVLVSAPSELTMTGVAPGTATITVTADDGNGGTASTAFIVTVDEANVDPVIDPLLPLDLTTGDSAIVAVVASDPNGDTLTLGATSDNEAVATVLVSSPTELTVTGVAPGTATITVTADDGNGGTASTAFIVTVDEANVDPVIDPLLPLNLIAGDSATVAVVASDPNGDALTLGVTSDNEAVATVLVSSPTELTVTGVAPGTATITVTADDGNGGTASTAFTVTVGEANVDPVIDPLLPLNLIAGDSATVAVVASDPNGDALTLGVTSDNEAVATVLVSSPTELTVTGVAPGTATITVTADDGNGGMASTAFTVTVGEANVDPVIDPLLPLNLIAGDSATVAVVASDPNGDALTLGVTSDNEAVATVLVSSPTELTVTGVAPGTATITVTADDGNGGTASTAFTVTVGEANVDPTIEPLLPLDLIAGDSATVAVVASDPNGDALTLGATSDNEAVATVLVSSPTELTVTGVAPGTATITVTADDGRGGLAGTAFTVTVVQPNQDPIIQPIAPVTVNAGESIPVVISYNDPDGDAVTVTPTVDNPGVASVSASSPTELTVTGAAAGTATVTVTLDDGRGGSAGTAFTVTVVQPNQDPIIQPIAPVTVNAGESIPVVISYNDPDGDAVTVTPTVDNPGVASVSASSPTELTVTGAAAGTATVTVTLDDGRGGAAGTAFTVTVVQPNQDPIIQPIAPVTVNAGESIPVVISYNDPDGDAVTVTPTVDNPGVASVFASSPTELTVTGAAAGTATVTVTLDDGRGGAAGTAFTVTVVQPNQDPIIQPIAPVTVNAGESIPVVISYNDPDGDAVTVTPTVDNPGVASVSASSPTELTVTGAAAGTATVTVTLDDGRGGSAGTAFTVTVVQPNQDPIIQPIAPVTVNAGESIPVVISYNDPDGDAVTVTPTVDNPGVASVSASSPTELTVTGAAAGTATVTVTLDDGRGGSAGTAFTVTVVQPNQDPIIQPIAPVTVNAGESIPVVISYNDPDGDAVTVTPTVDNPGVASVSASSPTELTVTGAAAGTATIIVTVDDGRGGAASTAFTVTVTEANQSPFIDALPPLVLQAGQSQTVAVSYSDPNGDAVTLTAASDAPRIAAVTVISPVDLQIDAANAGTATIIVTVDDGRGGVNSTAFTVTVEAEPVGPPDVPPSAFDVTAYPAFSDLETMLPFLQSVYSDGINNLGRNPIAFSVAGDELFNNADQLDPIVRGEYVLGNRENLQAAIDWYNFDFRSVAYGEDWTIETLFDNTYADPELCLPGEAPLACELRVNAPTIIIIGFTPENALAVPPNQFEAGLQQAVDMTLNAGTIPILVTMPDDGTVPAARLAAYNQIIVNTATQHPNHPGNAVPVLNLYVILQGVPGGVYGVGGAGPVDLSPAGLDFGVNRRSAALLTVLDELRQRVIAP